MHGRKPIGIGGQRRRLQPRADRAQPIIDPAWLGFAAEARIRPVDDTKTAQNSPPRPIEKSVFSSG
jgi:hypothetical protein